MITTTILPSGARLRWDHAHREGMLTVPVRKPDGPTRIIHTTEAAACVAAELEIGTTFLGKRTSAIAVWART